MSKPNILFDHHNRKVMFRFNDTIVEAKIESTDRAGSHRLELRVLDGHLAVLPNCANVVYVVPFNPHTRRRPYHEPPRIRKRTRSK